MCGWTGFGPTIVSARSLHFIGTLDEMMNNAEIGLIRFRKPKAFFFQEGHKFPILNKKIIETVRAFVKKADEKRYRELINYDKLRARL